MSSEEQKKLITPYITDGFITEEPTNVGANHLLGLCLSITTIGRTDSDAENEFITLREAILKLTCKMRKPSQWGSEKMLQTDDWEIIRNLAKNALEQDGYQVSPPKKPLEIIEYSEHFEKITK